LSVRASAESAPCRQGSERRQVVVVGGGFGGLHAVQQLRHAPVDVTLIDRNNYHLFQPLSYQVATAALSPDEIGKPLRAIFRSAPNVRVLMQEVTGFDLHRKMVLVSSAPAGRVPSEIRYDTLIVAAGSDYAYFGHDDWRPLAAEVKSLESAIRVRGRILRAFEVAEAVSDPLERASWLTFVVVGGGSTGVEIAGQIAELARDTLPGDFRAADTRGGRVVLVERAERVLPSFPPSLSKSAARSLRRVGVTPLIGHSVVALEPGLVEVRRPDGSVERVAARTVVWAAGVTASRLADSLAAQSGAPRDRSGRVLVEPDLTLPGHPEVFAIGDMVRVRDARSGLARDLPCVAPVAMQQGRHAGHVIGDRQQGRSSVPFRYRDKGSLATIGRTRAVADLRGVKLKGFAAWMIWLGVHLFYLIGFENRVVVLVRWSYNFFTHGRGARLITEPARDAPSAAETPSSARDAAQPIDVSVTIDQHMPIYEGDPGVGIELAKSIDRGDPANVSRLEMGAHTGTHVDAPRHFLPEGPGANELPVQPFVGPCVVADAMGAHGTIDATLIESLHLPPGVQRVLFKTPNSRLWDRQSFSADYVRLDPAGASALLERGVGTVGIDYLSIGDPDTHRLLLGRGVAVIEGLDLRGVEPGDYYLECLPLKIAGADGAPARALLWPL
jgi:NADH dehydrogenase